MHWVQWHKQFMNGIKQRISDWQPRKLLCFSAAFSIMAALVTAFVSYEVADWQLLLAAVCAVVTVILALTFGEKLIPFTLGMIFGFIWCVGFVELSYLPVREYIGYGGDLELQVLEYPNNQYPEALQVRILQASGKAVRVKARIYLDEEIPDIKPGDVLHTTGVICDGDLSLSKNRFQKGIYLTVQLTDDAEIIVESDGALDIWCSAAQLSKAMQQRIQTCIPGEPGNLLAAMISGDSSLCGKNLHKALINTGLAHIAAVSGLHISILAGFFVAVFGKRKGYLIALPLILGYAVIAGASPSAMRAVIMQGILMLSVFTYREYDPMTALFTALLCLVLQNPFAILSTSLVLSFTATFGILLMNQTLLQTFWRFRPKTKVLAKPYHWLSSTISVSLSAMLFTMPVTLLIFGRASMLSLVSNVLTIWAVSISMIGGMLLLLLSLLSMPVALAAAKIVSLPLVYLVWVIRGLGSLTLFVGQAGSLIFEVGSFAALICMILVRISKKTRATGILVVGCALMIAFLLGSLEPVLYNQIQIYGNYGAPILLIRDGGRTIAVGTGKDGDRSLYQIEEGLSKWGRTELSAVVCLSDRVKSTGGLQTIVDYYAPEHTFLPEHCVMPELGQHSIWNYADAGVLSIPDTTGKLELIPVTDKIWAMRWICNGVSVLTLYDGQPMEVAVGVEAYPGDLSADILITDAQLLNSTHAIKYICGRVSPLVILAADSGYDTLPNRILGVPVESLNENGMITLTTKR